MPRFTKDKYAALICKLQTHSMTGDTCLISKTLSQFFDWMFMRPRHLSSILKIRSWARIPFLQCNIPSRFKPNKTAFYYAAVVAQQAETVELYMCLYIISNFSVQRFKSFDPNIAKAFTFRDWFRFFGTACLGLKFNMKDFDECVDDSNNKVQQLLTKKLFNINYVINRIIIFTTQFKNHSALNARIGDLKAEIRHYQKKMKPMKQPRLNNSDIYDVKDANNIDTSTNYWDDDDDEEDDFDHDAYDNENDHQYFHTDSNDTQSLDNDNDESLVNDDDISISYFSRPEIVEQDNYIFNLGGSDEFNFSEWEDFLKQDEEEPRNDNIIELDHDDFDLVSELNENINNEGENQEEEHDIASASWDVVSDMQSVMSVDTFATKTATKSKSMVPPSPYRDAILKMKAAGATSPSLAKKRNVSPSSAKMKDEVEVNKDNAMAKIEEEGDNDMMQDAFFDLEGTKYGRGGGYKYRY